MLRKRMTFEPSLQWKSLTMTWPRFRPCRIETCRVEPYRMKVRDFKAPFSKLWVYISLNCLALSLLNLQLIPFILSKQLLLPHLSLHWFFICSVVRLICLLNTVSDQLTFSLSAVILLLHCFFHFFTFAHSSYSEDSVSTIQKNGLSFSPPLSFTNSLNLSP